MNNPQTNEKHLWVSWDEYHRLIERLALDQAVVFLSLIHISEPTRPY